MKIVSRLMAAALAAAVLVGCSSTYNWRRTSVPSDVRTVYVPTFRNESNVSELGALATRQILREFQREGTFKIETEDEAAIEIQGVVRQVDAALNAYNRRSASRAASFQFVARAEVTIIDKRSRKVLVNNKIFTATTYFTAAGDMATSKRDASGRAMEDLARQVVDCVLGLKW